MKTLDISPEVRAVLDQCTFTETSVILPNVMLARPLYEAVNKVLDAAGGKWNKKAKAHLFPKGVRPLSVFTTALAKGEIVHEKKSRQAFYTPPEVAALVAKRAEIGQHDTVLEPSAGEGALVVAALGAQPALGSVIAVENDPRAAGLLREVFSANPRVQVVESDFLKFEARATADRVLMNPPFADGQEVAHVRHAFRFLKPGGRLVAIMSPAITFRTDERYTELRDWLNANTEDRALEELPENSFRESGTNVRTILLSCRYVG
jgi:precorrin-6B methylase 2